MKGKSKNIIFYFILFFIPVLFFVLLEITLRAVNYGYDTSVFTMAKPGWYEVNPNLARKYFHNVKKTPSTNKDVFRIEKSPNSFRVFILGGSSGAGYPYIPLGSFSRYIRKRLELAYPAREIEVVNMSMTAINSYTLLDVFPEVLEQKPDLILIYAGHNEYYGALGVGSMENIGNSPFVVNLILKLENLKTFQLVRNVIKWAASKIVERGENKSGTLMSRMAEKKKIPYKSELYYKGIQQFKENLTEILEKAKKSNVPVIISTLACNLLDQTPFISEKSGKYPSAESVYLKGKEKLDENNVSAADSLFRYAKDLDMLRFRAPEKINKIIIRLAEKYNAPLADSYRALKNASELKIIGDDLMTDHLHPNLSGYQIIGKTFYETMAKNKLLPKEKPAISYGFQHKLTVERFDFTVLDSISASMKIRLLKNDWPFVAPNEKLPSNKLFELKNKIDSLAWKFVSGEIDWINAHLQLAEYYFARKNYEGYVRVMKTVTSQFPIVPRFYHSAVTNLISVDKLDDAYDLLLKQYKKIPDAFCAKWLGIINLKKGKNNAAIFYLKKSLEYNGRDAQVYYNLSGAYVSGEKYAEALRYVNKALRIQPNYKQAENLKRQLESVLKKN